MPRLSKTEALADRYLSWALAARTVAARRQAEGLDADLQLKVAEKAHAKALLLLS